MSSISFFRTPWEAVRGFSVEHANRLGKLALHGNSVEQQLEGLLALAFCRAIENNSSAAVDLLREAAFLSESVNPEWLPRVHYLHGVVQRELGEHLLSVEAHERALRKAIAVGHKQEIPVITQSLGMTLFRMECRKEALELWLMVEEDISRSDLPAEYGHLLAMIAHYHLREGEYGLAEERYGQAIRAFASASDDAHVLLSKGRLAIVWLEQGRALEAVEHLRRACLFAESEMRARSEATLLHYLGKALLLTGQTAEGEETLLRAVEKCVQMRMPGLLRQTYRLLIDGRTEAGDTAGALELANRFMAASEALEVRGVQNAEIAMRAVQLAHDWQEKESSGRRESFPGKPS